MKNKEEIIMREIKFRAWNKVPWYMTSWITLKQISEWFIGLNSNIIMQYTWMKDKKWVEIYEWDIVERYWVMITGTIEEKKEASKKVVFKGVVSWDNEELYYDYDKGNLWIYEFIIDIIVWRLFETYMKIKIFY